MSLLDALKIAFKNLWRRKLRTSLTIFAVSIGVIAVVTLVSIALGAQAAFIQQFESIGMLSKITVLGMPGLEDVGIFNEPNYSEDDPDATKLDDEVIAGLEKIDHVREVYPELSPYTYSTMIIDLNGEEKRLNIHMSSSPVTSDPDDQTSLAAGRFFNSNEEKNVVIIGDSYRRTFGLTTEELIGKEVKFRSYGGHFGLDDELPDPFNSDEDTWREHYSIITAEVIGVSTAGPAESGVYVSIAWAKDMAKRKEYHWPDEEDYKEWDKQMQLGLATRADEPGPVEIIEDELEDRGYSNLAVYVDDPDNVEAVAAAIEEKYEVTAITMEDLLAQLGQIFTILEIVLAIIGSISLGVAAIGIVNTMVMSIYERTREIGVMKAVGASKAAIRKLFTIEASLIGLLGGAIGLAAGYGLSLVANQVANHYMSQESIPLTDIIQLPLYLTLGVLAFSTIIGTLAGLYPAWRAARLDPIKSLHSE